MRVLVSFALGLVFSTAASAADLKVKVLDPQSTAVASAQVVVVRRDERKILAVQSTSAEGTASFHIPSEGRYQIQVLAPGFAAESIEFLSQTEITVRLRLATASETVVVSATRTPVRKRCSPLSSWRDRE